MPRPAEILGIPNCLLKNAVVAIVQLAQLAAQPLAARFIASRVAIWASLPGDSAGRRMHHRSARRAWLVAALAIGPWGCVRKGEPWAAPSLQNAPPFSSSGVVLAPNPWWTAFQDRLLFTQIDRSLAGNLDLAAAWGRLNAASAVVRREASDLWPDLNAFALADGTVRTDGPNASNFAVGLDAAYEVDLWGRIRSRVDAERFRASATKEDLDATALSLSAEVARAWYTLVEARAQLELLGEQLETNRTVLELQEARWGQGQIRSADVLRQRQFVESTREQAVVVQARIALLEHVLAVLEGVPPQQTHYETGAVLPRLPPLPNAGLPAELVNRRPDVRREFQSLLAADRDMASAVSEQYPRLNLTGSVISAAESPENLFRDWIASIAGQLVGPLLDGGQRRAEVDRTSAVVQQRLAEYGRAILIAFREVEDALASETYLVERIARLDTQTELARQASEQLRQQYIYFPDETDFLDVLSATTEEQRLQRATLSARLDLVLTRISLYLALAGDVASRPPAPFPGSEPAPLDDD